ncbi:AEC family transporter [Pseudoflavonifractor sp. MSJ-37]|nr:AEC family transporter [Pseudoflavonifractor sp. MSJ-37]
MISLLLMKQIGELFLMILLGFVLVRAGLLRSEDSKPLSVVVLYLVSPCMMLNAFQIEKTEELVHGLLLSLLAAVSIHILLFLLITVFGKVLKLTVVEQASVMYSNAGNLIIPLVTAILGSQWVVFTSVFLAIQVPLLWTHCRSLLSGERSASVRDIVLNPNILATAGGAVLFLLGVRLPAFLTEPMSSMGSMIGPLSMLVAGMLIGGMDMKKVLSFRGIWKMSALRLIVVPLVLALLLKYSGLAHMAANGTTILMVSLLAAATPSAATVMQMSQIFDRDAEYASAIYVVTTLLCIVTMPVIIWVYQV